jgi:hypothetical protein
MATETPTIDDTPDVAGVSELIGDLLIAEDVPVPPLESLSPIDLLAQAHFLVSGLGVAGANSNIRYSASRAARMINSLLRDLEHHRRVVGNAPGSGAEIPEYTQT